MKAIVFEVKKFKSFIGNEGHGFNAELWMDGKKACFVIDEASGGEYQFQWVNRDFEKQFGDYVKSLPVEPLDEDAEDWEKKLYPNGREWSEDVFMAMLTDLHQSFASLKRKAAKSTLFVLPNCQKGAYYSSNLPFSPENKARILSSPKNAGAKFINEHLSDGKWIEMIGMKPLPVPA